MLLFHAFFIFLLDLYSETHHINNSFIFILITQNYWNLQTIYWSHMNVTYHQVMNLKQIIGFLTNNQETNTYPRIVVEPPTITNMIKGLKKVQKNHKQICEQLQRMKKWNQGNILYKNQLLQIQKKIKNQSTQLLPSDNQQIRKLQHEIENIKDLILDQQKIRIIHDRFAKISQGQIEIYKPFLKSSQKNLKIPIQQLLRPIVQDYQKISQVWHYLNTFDKQPMYCDTKMDRKISQRCIRKTKRILEGCQILFKQICKLYYSKQEQYEWAVGNNLLKKSEWLVKQIQQIITNQSMKICSKLQINQAQYTNNTSIQTLVNLHQKYINYVNKFIQQALGQKQKQGQPDQSMSQEYTLHRQQELKHKFYQELKQKLGADIRKQIQEQITDEIANISNMTCWELEIAYNQQAHHKTAIKEYYQNEQSVSTVRTLLVKLKQILELDSVTQLLELAKFRNSMRFVRQSQKQYQNHSMNIKQDIQDDQLVKDIIQANQDLSQKEKKMEEKLARYQTTHSQLLHQVDQLKQNMQEKIQAIIQSSQDNKYKSSYLQLEGKYYKLSQQMKMLKQGCDQPRNQNCSKIEDRSYQKIYQYQAKLKAMQDQKDKLSTQVQKYREQLQAQTDRNDARVKQLKQGIKLKDQVIVNITDQLCLARGSSGSDIIKQVLSMMQANKTLQSDIKQKEQRQALIDIQVQDQRNQMQLKYQQIQQEYQMHKQQMKEQSSANKQIVQDGKEGQQAINYIQNILNKLKQTNPNPPSNQPPSIDKIQSTYNQIISIVQNLKNKKNSLEKQLKQSKYSMENYQKTIEHLLAKQKQAAKNENSQLKTQLQQFSVKANQQIKRTNIIICQIQNITKNIRDTHEQLMKDITQKDDQKQIKNMRQVDKKFDRTSKTQNKQEDIEQLMNQVKSLTVKHIEKIQKVAKQFKIVIQKLRNSLSDSKMREKIELINNKKIEIQQLRKQLTKLSEQKGKYIKDIGQFQQKDRHIRSQIQKLQKDKSQRLEQMTKIQQQVLKSEQIMSQTQQKIQKVEEDYNNLKCKEEQIKQMSQRYEELQRNSNALNRQYQNSKRKVQENQKNLQQIRKQIQSSVESKKLVGGQIQQQQQLLLSRQQRLKDINQKINRYSEQQVNSKKKELDQLQHTLEQKQWQLKDIESRCEQMCENKRKIQEEVAQKWIQIQQKQNKCKQEWEQINKKQTQQSQKQNNLLMLSERLKDISQQNIKCREQNIKISDQNSLLKKRLEQIIEQTQEKQRYFEQLKQIISKEEQELKKIKKQAEQTQDEYRKQKLQLQQNFKQLQFIRKQSQDQTNNCLNLKQQSIVFSVKNKQIKQQIQKLESESRILKSQNEEMARSNQAMDKYKQIKQQLTKEIAQLQIKVEQLTNEACKLKIQTADNRKTIQQAKQIESKLRYLNSQVLQKQTKISEMQTKSARIQSKIKQKQASLRQAQKQCQKAHKHKAAILQQIASSSRILDKVANQNKEKRKEAMRLDGFLNRLFVGQVLEHDDQDSRFYIVDHLNKLYPQKQIIKTKLLFSYPLMSGINPHNQVDNRPFYIVIMKMKNKDKRGRNYLVSMYSQRPLTKSSQINNGAGFICSITNQKIYGLRKPGYSCNPRVTQYNQYFFVYGNSELRFRIQSNKLNSCIGNNYRSYDTGDLKNAQVFTGSSEEDSQIMCYEFYQIIFKESPESVATQKEAHMLNTN